MKTKHNTMNSSSSSRTYIKMLSKLLKDNECCCFWVEAIAKTSQNIKWETNIDKERSSDQRLRRVSIDKFFEIVTGQSDAFYQICMVLPEVIQEIVNKSNLIKTNDDTVYEELQELAKRKQGSFILALYMLGFESYIGF